METNKELQEDLKEIEKWLSETRGLESGLQIVDKEGSINFKCDGCRDGKSECCTNRDDILIAPYDMYKMQKGLNRTYDEIVDKGYVKHTLGADSKIPILILQNNYTYDGEKICKFLKRIDIDGQKKRGCSIHKFKPSVCELFPLGRFTKIDKTTKDKKMYYVLQDTSCGIAEDNVIKIRDWALDIDNSERAFLQFNDFLSALHKKINVKNLMVSKQIPNEEKKIFVASYFTTLYSYDTNNDFFEQFDVRSEIVLKIAENFTKTLKKYDKSIIPK